MYRLRVIPIFIPPLRERGADIVMLAERIIEEMNARSQRIISRISPGAQAALSHYNWPGNVRELRNALEYAFAIGDGTLLVESDLPPEVLEGEGEERSRTLHADPTNPIVGALEQARDNRVLAARSLGISRSTLWRRMKELGLLEPSD